VCKSCYGHAMESESRALTTVRSKWWKQMPFHDRFFVAQSMGPQKPLQGCTQAEQIITNKESCLKAKKPPPRNPLLVEVVLKRRMHFVKVRPDLCIPVPLPCRPHTRHARDTSSRAVWQSNEARAMTVSAGRRLASIVT